MEIVPHISDDTLERYAMESLRGSDSEPLEERHWFTLGAGSV